MGTGIEAIYGNAQIDHLAHERFAEERAIRRLDTPAHALDHTDLGAPPLVLEPTSPNGGAKSRRRE